VNNNKIKKMSKDKTIKTINPATGKTLETYNYISDADMNSAIEKTQKAFLDWRHQSLEKRANVIKAIGKKLVEYKDELSKLMTNEMGKILPQSNQEVDLCAGLCKYTAKKV